MLIDTYLCSSDQKAIEAFCAAFSNVIGPSPGRKAVEAGTDSDGNGISAQAAAGDPLTWYAVIRADRDIALPEGLSSCAATLGQTVLGVWA